MLWDVGVGATKTIIFLLFVYVLGYFGFSPLWPGILLVFTVMQDKKNVEKKRKLLVRRVMALGDEKNVILESLKDKDAWLKFNEFEKVEWINQMLCLLWPQINDYAKDALPKIFEPALESYVADFKFHFVEMGHIPLRVEGINVYEPIDKRKIEMDLDISYSGDCYMTFQSLKFTGGVKDISVQGRLRVVLTPLISKFPLIGGLRVYYMTPPNIDFELIKAAQILDFSVIKNRIKTITLDVLNTFLLYPNSISLNLNEDVNLTKLAAFRVQGILRVHVVEAKNLKKTDRFGNSDPYTILKVGSIKVTTPVVKNSLNPKWDFWAEFEVEPNSELAIEVWDKDDGLKDDFLGRGLVDVSQVARMGQVEMPLPLQGIETGTIYLRMAWLSLSDQYEDLAPALQETRLLSPDLHSALLVVYLESSANLTHDATFVELEVEGVVKTGEVEKGTRNPVWERGFNFLLKDPEEALLRISLKDAEEKKVIGGVMFEVKELMQEERMDVKSKTFSVYKPNTQMSICCSLRLRVLKGRLVEETKKSTYLKKQPSNVSNFSKSSAGPSGSDEDDDYVSNLGQIKLSIEYSSQRQKLLIEVIEVNIFNGKPIDPYVKLSLRADQTCITKKTKVIKNTTNPVYKEHFEFVITTQDLIVSTLNIEVKSSGFMKAKYLGKLVLDLSQCDELNPLTEWFNLYNKKDETVCRLIVENDFIE